MADSPSKYKDRIVAWTINCDGKALDDSYKLVYAQVHLAINRIGKATLKFYAGDMDKQTFDETDANSFKPGTTIRIDVGNIDKQNTDIPRRMSQQQPSPSPDPQADGHCNRLQPLRLH